ncbi:GPI transamidase component PIG-S isoform X2 [Stomoxys calcitrans]|uniref:GPI transamidase component PIG-S isoform X2 n=1 Tax=Stomoxys calcitrans TaxID=35570 RepID=UPI0027E23651|nr:GPI transamidase component PIG-S isoform X2 [Stomoxys calcitrans]
MDTAKGENKSPHNHNKDDATEDKFRLYATIAFMTVVIIIGVPMWWKSTEVYRVSLPSSDIMELSDKPLKIKIKVGIFNVKNERAALLINELKEEYSTSDIWNLEFLHKTNFEKANTIRTPAALESLLLKDADLREGDFAFIEWPKLQEEVLITNERTALIRSDTTSKKLKQVLNTYILQTHRIKQILAKEQRDALKTEAPQAEYDVTVSVLNPRPDIMDAKWHVQMAVETYLKPYLDQVSHISNYTLTTQWKYQLAFEADLRQVRDNSLMGRHYALSESSLPHIITAIEKNLGSGITDKTPLNLIVYITPCDIAPVYIYNKRNQRASADNISAFISPKWGGIIIANPSMETCREYNDKPSQRVSFFVQTNDVMQIMLHQLQKLLDISVEVHAEGVKTVAVEQLAPRLWEYESYLRRSAVTHITTTTNTLQSLIKLLDNISYIVINDDVGKAINSAYELIIKAKEALANHQLMRASELAQQAFLASEQAFFDASLLAQLYFPDEQKYAIYIPLFLPIMVPVVTSFSMMVTLLKKQRESRQSKLKTT